MGFIFLSAGAGMKPALTNIFICNLHLLYHRRLREAITGRSSGSRIVLLITPSHPIESGQWHCDVRSRLQRRVRSSSRLVKRDMDSLLLPNKLEGELPVIDFINKKNNCYPEKLG